MIALDTNVLIRYLTRDDEPQWEKSVKIIESGELCFIFNLVLCEIIWVLRSKSYQLSKDEIINTIEMMLQCPVFEWENTSVVYQSLQRFKQGKGDFSDYLIGTIAKSFNCNTTVTYDLKLKNEKGFTCLSD